MTTADRLALAACPFPLGRQCPIPCDTCQRTAVSVIAELITILRLQPENSGHGERSGIAAADR